MLGFSEPLKFCQIDEQITCSQWANTYRRLSPESSAEAGQFSTKRAPHQEGMLDALNNPRYKKIVFMTSAQTGKSETLINLVGYIIDRDPGPILLAQPNITMGETWSRDRFAPMVRDTPALRNKVVDVRGIHAADGANVNTVLSKSFPGGRLTIVGSSSPSGFAGRPIRYFIGDEVDLWEQSAGKNGDQLTLGSDRTQTYWNSKIVYASTPLLKITSRIEPEYEESDKRKRFVPCPHCEEMQTLEWENMRWGTGKPETAHFLCIACKKEIREAHKFQMLEQGEWRAEHPERDIAGFFLWAAYSTFPGMTWSDIAEKYESAKKRGHEAMQAFWNTVLARTWEDEGDAPEWQTLAEREEDEPYDPFTVPSGIYFLTAGADVQIDRIEVSIYGWGKYEESWVVGHAVIYGKPTEQDTWARLDGLLKRTFRQESTGRDLAITLTCIDSGHETQEVYGFCRPRPYIRAIKGSNDIAAPFVGHPTKRDVNWRGKTIEAGISLWSLGVGKLKETLYSRLKTEAPGPRYIHFCEGLDLEWYQGLCAEKKVTIMKKGYPKQEWRKILDRNEPLDCAAYAYAAAIMLGIQWMNWDKMAPPERINRSGNQGGKSKSTSTKGVGEQRVRSQKMSAAERFLRDA